MNTLFKKFLGFSMGPVIGAFISFITIPLTTYFISPEEYGKASMFTLFQVLIITLLYLGLDQAYTREYHESDNKINLLKNAMFLPLIFSILIFILIYLNLNTVSTFLFGSDGYNIATVLFGLTIIFLIIERFLMLSIRMEEKAMEYSLLSIILKLNVLIFTLLFVLLVRRDFLAVVYSTALGQLVADLYLIIRYRKYFSFSNFYIDKALISKLLKFGAPLILTASFTHLLNSLDRIGLRAWSTFYEIGLFTAALKISGLLTIIQTSFTSFWVPTAYRWFSENKDIKHYEFVSRILLLVMSVVLILILLLKDLIVILLGNEYVDTKFIIGLLCLHPIMYTISETTTLGIVFSRKSYYNIWVSVLSIISNVILIYLLIPKYGAVGAAVATGVTYIIFFLARSYLSNKCWIGFSIKPHIIVSAILFIATIVNAMNFEYINLINCGFLLLIILTQITTIKKFISIYTKKNSEEWDFS